jgi:hypothetical protein
VSANRTTQTPSPVTERLAAADRRMQREKGGSFALRTWPWLCGAVLLVFAVDVALHLEAWPRVAVLASLALLCAGVVAVATWIAWVRRNSLEHVARELEARDAALGSKLINLLQLDAQTTDPRVAPLTRELAGRAIAGYAGDLDRCALEQLARTDRVQRDAKCAAWGVAGFLALLAVLFDVTRTEVLRFLDPFGDHPPYSFTRIEISEPADDLARVIYGQGVLIQAKTGGHRPRELWLSYWPPEQAGAVVTVPMFDKGDRGFAQQIEGVKSDLVVVAHTKNKHSVSKQRRVGVVLTPKLDGACVKAAPPAYTGQSVEERALQFKSLKALAGTRLDFRLRSNRPLREGVIEVIKSTTETERVPLTPTGEMEVSGGFEAGATARLRFALVDRDGHASQETWEVALQVTHDLGPEVSIDNPGADCFAALDFKMEPVIEAQDDYGVKTLRIHQAHNGVYGEPRVIEAAKVERHLREVLTLDFKTMEVKAGDTISLFAEAIDTAPESHLARSSVVTITLVSIEDYNAYLREQTDMADIAAKFSELNQRLQDLIEEQKELGAQSEALRQQAEKAGPAESAALAPKLDELLAKQNEVNAKLNKLAEHMESFVRDQPLFDVETELKDNLAEKARELRESARQNDADNRAVAQQGEFGPQQPGEFKQASDQQLARLGATEQELAQEVVAPLEDLALLHELMKDLNRFKELFDAQQQVAAQAKAYDRAGPLTREDQLALKDLAAIEKRMGEELDAVEQKIWEDAVAAEPKFPKAAQSGKALAQRMGDLRLQMHANHATDAMLAGRGDQGAQLAQRLVDEMNKLFCEECKNGGQQTGDELDGYLRLTRGMNPGNNFKQMMQCKKFGSNPGRFGMGAAGQGGLSGYSVQTGPNASVFGNETRANSSSKRAGKGMSKAEPLGGAPQVAVEQADALRDLNARNRESGAVQGELTVEQYRDLVEKYFQAITK